MKNMALPASKLIQRVKHLLLELEHMSTGRK